MALFIYKRARRGHDRMVVVFTAICATSAYEHQHYEFVQCTQL
jgi:hypothetical protein